MPRPLCLLIALLVATLLPPAWPTGATAAPRAPLAATGALIVGTHAGAAGDLAALSVPRLATTRLLGGLGETVEPLGGGAYRLGLTDLESPAATTDRLLRDPRVRYVEPDYLLSLAVTGDLVPFAGEPNEPAWPRQQEMRRVEAQQAWEVTTGRPEVLIAVLDSGVLASHVDLAGKTAPGYDFLANRGGATDDQGHGTFTAALAAGIGNNAAGIAGVCWRCRVLPLKMLDSRGLGPTSAFTRAIRYAVGQGARVINVSAGLTDYSVAMAEVVQEAIERDVVVIAAAGNEGEDRPVYPAAFPGVVAVAATDQADRPAAFSSFGAFVDIAAPGVGILSASTASNQATVTRNGTSASAPIVSGAAGLLLSLHPNLSAQRVKNLLLDTTIDLGEPGRDARYGAGRLSIYDAVLAAGLDATEAEPARAELSAARAPFRVRLTTADFEPNEPLRVFAGLADGHVLPIRALTADGRGALDTTLPLTCDVPAGPFQMLVVGDQSRQRARASVTLATPPARDCFQPLPPRPSTADRLYFPETGHTLAGGFRAFWERNGGLAVFGYPISEEFRELNLSDGQTYTVQYFERNRFEHHPELAGTPHEIQLGLLGSLLTAGRPFPPAVAPPPGPRRAFPATGLTVGGEFLDYWEARGGLAIFGYPISPTVRENGRLVQYFERNRFEWHPELEAPHRVLLGLLGNDLARRNRYTG